MKAGSKWRYADSSGQTVIPIQYCDAYSFQEGLAKVKRKGYVGFVNRHGEEVISLKFTNAGVFSGGLAPVRNDKALWGFIDISGTGVIVFKYLYAQAFHEGVARVMQNGKWMEIDRSGRVLKED